MDMIVGFGDRLLVTGAAGFIGKRLVRTLLERGFSRVRCFVRPTGNRKALEETIREFPAAREVEIVEGNLLSEEDCTSAVRDVSVIYHLAAGRGSKSFPDAFMNSAVATRNLLRSATSAGSLRRFVNVSSFSVYTNQGKRRRRLLDETCPVESHPELRGDAYCFAKVKQEEIVAEYARDCGVPCVTLRPGVVFGPGKEAITGRVGLSGYGVFLHLGGFNPIPFTYIDNCADAIAVAGLKRGIDGEAFNVVDDDLATSRRFLSLYKNQVNRIKSIYLPHAVSYLLCCLWEKYSAWSEGQLPPVYNRRAWHAYWKRTHYCNDKLKDRLGWKPETPLDVAFTRFFESCRAKGQHV